MARWIAFIRKNLITSVLASSALMLISGSRAAASQPAWWGLRAVVVEGAAPADFELLNQGQLKQLALAAFLEMEAALPGGAGLDVTALLNLWTVVDTVGNRVPNEHLNADDYSPVNLGQLKATAGVFYDRLIALQWARGYPWAWIFADDFALANLGQAKSLFAFPLDQNRDINANGIPDWWEMQNLGSLFSRSNMDSDWDGILDFDEFELGTDPNDFFNGHTPVLNLVSGEGQISSPGEILPERLTVRLAQSDGTPIASAPVTFQVLTGGNGGLFDAAEPTTQHLRRLTVFTDVNGIASAQYIQPDSIEFTSRLQVFAGNAEPLPLRSFTTTDAEPLTQAAPPEFSVDGGAHRLPQTIQVRCGTPGALMYYTTNGAEPTSADTAVEDGGFIFVGETLLLKATAFRAGIGYSATKSAAFQIGREIWSGSSHTLALDLNGTLWAWGGNDAGQLGIGTTVDQNAPFIIPGIGEVRTAATGAAHSLAVLARGGVLAWGYNGDGQLGDGTRSNRVTPVSVIGMRGVLSVAAGAGHSVAVCEDGTVWAWGANEAGQLGHGDLESSLVPTRVPVLSQVRFVVAGERFTVALKADGTVWAWGAGENGQLGRGVMGGSAVPVQVTGLTEVVAISAGAAHVVALKADGAVWVWGKNADGQLGLGDTQDRSVPTLVPGLPLGVLAVAAGQAHTLALQADKTALAWGKNDAGQVVRGGPSQVLLPMTLGGLAITTIAAGNATLTLDTGGHLWSSQTGDTLTPDAGGGNNTGNNNVPTGTGGRAQNNTPLEAFTLGFSHQFLFFAEPETFIFQGEMRSSSTGDGNDYGDSYLSGSALDLKMWETNGQFYANSILWFVSAGTYIGPRSETIEEAKINAVLDARPLNGQGGILKVTVQAPDGPATVREFQSDFSDDVFSFSDNAHTGETLANIPVGSRIRFTADGLTQTTVGFYGGRTAVRMRLNSLLPQTNPSTQSSDRVNAGYLLFKEKGLNGAECLGHPVNSELIFTLDEPTSYALLPIELRDIKDAADTSDDIRITPWDNTQAMTEANVAWIEAHASPSNVAPRMPQLEFAIPDLPQTLTLLAKLEVKYDRGNGSKRLKWRNQPEDTVKIPATGEFQVVSGDTWKIWQAYMNEPFFGGDATLTYKLANGQKEVLGPQTIAFRIGGRNPQPANAKRFITSLPEAGEGGNLWFAYAIAKSESKDYNGQGTRYNQFLSLLPKYKTALGFPLWNDDGDDAGSALPGGYGLFQVTGNASDAKFNIPRSQIWNWQENARGGIAILSSKAVIARDWMAIQKDINNAHGVPLPKLTILGVMFSENTNRSMVHAVTMKTWNGAKKPPEGFVDREGPVPNFIIDTAGGHFCYWKNALQGWALSRYNRPNDYPKIQPFNYVRLVCEQVE